MPTILRKDGFRFYFYSEEGNEPMHVHVAHGDGRAKFWLEPDVVLAGSIAMKAKEIKKAKTLVQEHLQLIEEKWHEYDLRRQNP